MAGYRQFHTQFWKDEWLIELEPLERYLFSYLFTNDLSSISGIYKLPLRVISNETGLSTEYVSTTLAKFQASKKIFYKDGVMWVVNMMKYHKNASPRTMTKVNSDVREIPECDVKTAYLYHARTGIYSTDTVSIPRSESVSVSESLNRSVSESGSEKQDDNGSGGSVVDYDFAALCNVYEKNIGMLTPMIAEDLAADVNEFGLQNCLDAISEALANNIRKWSYVRGVLKGRKRDGRLGGNDKAPAKQQVKVEQFYENGELRFREVTA